MLNKNQIILLLVSLIIFAISGVLFYQGIMPEIKKIQMNQEVEGPEAASTELPQEINSQNTATKGGVLGNANMQSAKVVKVVDGDTIVVQIDGVGDQNFNVRFVGIDTPETVDPRRPVGCFGKEASNENKRLLEGKTVYLEKDISERDKYDRLLRYIYLKLDGGQMLFVNDYLVREGFAFAYTYPPDVKFAEDLAKAQTQARENNRGLWGACR